MSEILREKIRKKLSETKEYRLGMIAKKAKEKSDKEVRVIGDYNYGIALVTQNGKYGHINKNGKIIGKGIVWDDASPFMSPTGGKPQALVKKGNKKYFIDLNGSVIEEY